MPGIPTHFKILELTIKKLSASPSAPLRAIAKIMQDNPEYAYLGVIGPSLTDFIPSEPPPEGSLSGGNQYINLWKQVFSVIGDGMLVDNGLKSVLKRMIDFLDKVEPIAAAEDLGALSAMEDEVDTINQTAEQLKEIVEKIPDIAISIASGVGGGMKPSVCVATGATIPPSEFWRVRNFLFWKKSGDFTKALIRKAKASGNQQFLAYAYGYLVSYSANVVGNPFVNSIVAGPYRTQWWRQRWVDNYIDTWVHGYYEAGASMSGDTANPAYDQWPNLCDAKLHKKIELSGLDPDNIMTRVWRGDALPDTLPPEFGKLWVEAYTEVYGLPGVGSHIKPEAFNGAHTLSWLVLWLQTSREAFGCNPAPPMAPPSDCGSEPSWVDPTVAGDNGSGTSPPSPEIESDPDVGDIVTGVILALLGLALVAVGGTVPGAVAIAVGITKIIQGATDIDWAKLRCDLYWYRMYLYNGLNALHEILTVGAFAYPYASELDDDETVLELLGLSWTFDSGKALTKSRSRPDGFPAKCWGGFPAMWMQEPTTCENPQTVAYLTSEYPSFFIDDAVANPLANGEVRIGGQWPYRERAGGNGKLPVQFGNAVDNAIDLIEHLDDDLPNWNLDADRGLAYHTWQFKNGIYSDPVEIEPES